MLPPVVSALIACLISQLSSSHSSKGNIVILDRRHIALLLSP